MDRDLFNKLKNSPNQEEELDKLLEQAQSQPISGAALNTRTFKPKNRDERQARYEADKALRLSARSRKLPFISPDFGYFFELSQGLVIIGAESGKGKSSTLANIIAGFIENCPESDEGVVISNEESSEAVYNRAACILLGESFIAFHQGKLSQAREKTIEAKAQEILARVEVVDDPAWDMTCLEDVQAVLEYAAKRKVRFVALDYLQTVAFSRTKQHLEPFQVSKILGLYLKDYSKRVGIPAIVFAQLKPESESQEPASRVQNDKTIYNHCFAFMEIVPDFAARTTKFILYKDRFGPVQRAECTARFDKGRFIPEVEI